MTQMALDRVIPLEINFLPFYLLPDFFHSFQINTSHFQTPSRYNSLNLTKTALKFLVRFLQCGALLLIDYGFPRREFYHPQRGRGTLMCHYRHHSHPDPFYLPGLQDVTVHVDFTAIIAAADAAGLDLLGYASQGRFLLNCGILDLLAREQPGSTEYMSWSTWPW